MLLEDTDFDQFQGARRTNRDSTSQALLVMCYDTSSQAQARTAANLRTKSEIVESVSKPCGAYKIGKALRRCIDRLDAQKNLCSLGSGQVALRVHIREPALPRTSRNTDRHMLDEFAASRASQLMPMQPAGSNSLPPPEPEPHTESNAPVEPRPAPDRVFTNPNTPLKSKRPRASPLQRRSSEAPASQSDISPHILLVDDNKVNIRLLQTYCKQRRYRHVTSAENGQVAVDAVKGAATPVDIVLMDISMPVKNGFEATREIRAMEAQEPMRKRALIIMLTGLASGRDQAEGVAAGCDTYLTKPVSFQEVGRVIESKGMGDMHMATERLEFVFWDTAYVECLSLDVLQIESLLRGCHVIDYTLPFRLLHVCIYGTITVHLTFTAACRSFIQGLID